MRMIPHVSGLFLTIANCWTRYLISIHTNSFVSFYFTINIVFYINSFVLFRFAKKLHFLYPQRKRMTIIFNFSLWIVRSLYIAFCTKKTTISFLSIIKKKFLHAFFFVKMIFQWNSFDNWILSLLKIKY